jgi:hypothetical protein
MGRPRKKQAESLEQQAEKAGYSLEREKAGTLVLWPKSGATGTRFENEKQLREHLEAS